MKDFGFSNPWAIAAVNALTFAGALSAVVAIVAGLSDLNAFPIAFTVFMATVVVFWWAFHSSAVFIAGRATWLWAVRQGVLWSLFLSLASLLCLLVFATNLKLGELVQGRFWAQIAGPVLAVVLASIAVGASSGIVLYCLNRVLVRANPSIERTASGGLRPPTAAAHVER